VVRTTARRISIATLRPRLRRTSSTEQLVDRVRGFPKGLPTYQGSQRLAKVVVRTTVTTRRTAFRSHSHPSSSAFKRQKKFSASGLHNPGHYPVAKDIARGQISQHGNIYNHWCDTRSRIRYGILMAENAAKIQGMQGQLRHEPQILSHMGSSTLGNCSQHIGGRTTGETLGQLPSP